MFYSLLFQEQERRAQSQEYSDCRNLLGRNATSTLKVTTHNSTLVAIPFILKQFLRNPATCVGLFPSHKVGFFVFVKFHQKKGFPLVATASLASTWTPAVTPHHRT
jgi:hypothetical protein